MEGRSTNVASNLMVNETDKMISILTFEYKIYLNVIKSFLSSLSSLQTQTLSLHQHNEQTGNSNTTCFEGRIFAMQMLYEYIRTAMTIDNQ